VQTRARALADVQAGHFLGVPSGWLARPVRIYFRVYAHKNETRGGIVLVPGFNQGPAHGQELVRDLVAQRYSVYIHGHCGQSFSTWLLPGDGHGGQGHMDQFDHRVTDLERTRQLRRWADRASACTDTSPAEHCGHANAKVEGPTLRWVSQACSASQQAREPGAAGITPPVLLPNGGHHRACAAARRRARHRCRSRCAARVLHPRPGLRGVDAARGAPRPAGRTR